MAVSESTARGYRDSGTSVEGRVDVRVALGDENTYGIRFFAANEAGVAIITEAGGVGHGATGAFLEQPTTRRLTSRWRNDRMVMNGKGKILTSWPCSI